MMITVITHELGHFLHRTIEKSVQFDEVIAAINENSASFNKDGRHPVPYLEYHGFWLVEGGKIQPSEERHALFIDAFRMWLQEYTRAVIELHDQQKGADDAE